jgi:hypothetical protein
MAPSIVAPPASARWSSFDCQCCGHPELGAPVFVQLDGGQVIAAGSGCAARLVFGERTARTTREARKVATAAEAAAKSRRELAAVRLASKRCALEAWQAGRHDEPALLMQRRTWLATTPNLLRGEPRSIGLVAWLQQGIEALELELAA